MPKPTPADRIAEIQAQDEAERLERLTLDQSTLGRVLESALAAEAALADLGVSLSQLVSAVPDPALKAAATSPQRTVEAILTLVRKAQSEVGSALASPAPSLEA